MIRFICSFFFTYLFREADGGAFAHTGSKSLQHLFAKLFMVVGTTVYAAQ